jgi:hypothetical protein
MPRKLRLEFPSAIYLSNAWIAENLNMGKACSVSVLVSEFETVR